MAVKGAPMGTKKEDKPSEYKYLAGNIALFSISNFVSKILVFLLVPFYTNVLSTGDYGIADVMQTTLLLLVPALTINMGEAALRFGIDRADKRGEILRIGVKYVAMASLAVALVSGLACIFAGHDLRWYLFLFIFLFMTNCLYEFLILFFQGCEQVKIVVVGSVFSTIVLITCNIVFLLFVKIGLNGYLLSQMLAFLSASVLMLILGHKMMPAVVTIRRDINDEADRTFEKELISYGVPMIAYSTGSWINNAADRYLVSLIKGVAVNGVYGVAYKIPAILTVFQRIFAQAWQMSATKSYTAENSKEFFSVMYNAYNTFMVTGCAFLILTVRFVAAFMFKKDFYMAWQYVPPLLISVVFGALTGFLGSICLAYKDSKAMGFATGTGAVINIVLNLILIPGHSAMGAAVATGLSYFVMYFIAYKKVSGYVELEVKRVRDYVAYLLLVADAYLMIKGYSQYTVCSVIFVIIVVMYYSELRRITGKLVVSLLNKNRTV